MQVRPSPETNGQKLTCYEVNGVRWYQLEDGSWFDSVTKFASHYPKDAAFDKALASQGGRENAERIKEEARERGHNVHTGIERLLNGQQLKLDEFSVEEWKHLIAFRNWHEDVKPEVLATEEIVYSIRNRVAGTLDLRCVIGGKHWIIDHKTTSGIYRSHEAQVNEYGYMAREMGKQVNVVGVLRTRSRHKRGYEFKHWKLCQKTHELFEALLKIGRDFDPATEPKIEHLPSSLAL